jgi:hypothetical protein
MSESKSFMYGYLCQSPLIRKAGRMRAMMRGLRSRWTRRIYALKPYVRTILFGESDSVSIYDLSYEYGDTP